MGSPTHLSSYPPLGVTPDSAHAHLLQSFFWNWGGGGFPSPQKTQAPRPLWGGGKLTGALGLLGHLLFSRQSAVLRNGHQVGLNTYKW